ncbi:MAG: Phage DNA packaging protein Nu1 [Candidatus Accumulibacter phosphatis]|uniref:Phage DNA packaging protein Nu1 n=1 Tax=Candidatus Accumulibacter phosphatis TaxID=327160 RepID=A0A080MB24_9PROT|nr:MAG: Phage DNA packaging protein Nu1 [Candidatus Accumulibacter phosphatis]
MDLATERALLARAQRERIDLANAVTRRELAPVILIEQVLARAGSKVAGILDGIPGMIKRRVDTLSGSDLALIAAEIARARNVAAAVSLDDLEDEPAGGDRAAADETADDSQPDLG